MLPDRKTKPDVPSPAFNPDAARLKPSATLTISEKTAALKAAGHDVFQMGFGQSPFPVPAPLVTGLRRHAHEKAYLPVAGLPALRQAIADYTNRLEGIGVTADQVLVGPGSKELMFILQLVCDADVLIPAPSWVSYAPQAELFKRKVTWLPTDHATGMRITPEQLRVACRRNPSRSQLLILNYPSNPTGISYSAEQLEALADIAREFGLLVLSDEIYGGLHFTGGHASIARFYPKGTIISNGISKWCGAGGWRLGAFVLPPALGHLRDVMIAVASETYSAVAAPIQHAAVTAFEDDPELGAYLAGCRRILGALLAHAAKRLREAGAKVCEPEGGFYVFPDFSETQAFRSRKPVTAAEFCDLALAEIGVAMLPGDEFGYPPVTPAARIAIVDFDGEQALHAPGNSIDESFLMQHCQPVMNGIDRLCDWLSAN